MEENLQTNVPEATPVPENAPAKAPTPKRTDKKALIVVLVTIAAGILCIATTFLLPKPAPSTKPPVAEETQTENQENTATEKDTTTETEPNVNRVRIQGIDLIVGEALRVKNNKESDFLIVDVSFEANVPCPLTGGAVCGYNYILFKLVDEEGVLMDRTGAPAGIPGLKVESVGQGILREGEKTKGQIFFSIPKDTEKYYLTYGTPSGERTRALEITPKTYSQSENWETYTSSSGFSIKYPPEFTVKQIDENDVAFILQTDELGVPARQEILLSVEENPQRIEDFDAWFKEELNTTKFAGEYLLMQHTLLKYGDNEWLALSPSYQSLRYIDGGTVYWAKVHDDTVILIGLLNLGYSNYQNTVGQMLASFKGL